MVDYKRLEKRIKALEAENSKLKNYGGESRKSACHALRSLIDTYRHKGENDG